MKIKVEVQNAILGDSVFWEGDGADIAQIRNIPARQLAEQVVADGRTRKSGMWIVSEAREERKPNESNAQTGRG